MDHPKPTDTAPPDAWHERLAAQEREYLLEHWKHHAEIHRLEQQALTVAAEDMTRRLESMNALRLQITQERGEYLKNETYTLQHGALLTKLENIETLLSTRISALERAQSGAMGTIWALGGVLSVLTILLSVLFHFWGAGK